MSKFTQADQEPSEAEKAKTREALGLGGVLPKSKRKRSDKMELSKANKFENEGEGRYPKITKKAVEVAKVSKLPRSERPAPASKKTSSSKSKSKPKKLTLPNFDSGPLDYDPDNEKEVWGGRIRVIESDFLKSLSELYGKPQWVIMRLLAESFRSSEHCPNSIKDKP